MSRTNGTPKTLGCFLIVLLRFDGLNALDENIGIAGLSLDDVVVRGGCREPGNGPGATARSFSALSGAILNDYLPQLGLLHDGYLVFYETFNEPIVGQYERRR